MNTTTTRTTTTLDADRTRQHAMDTRQTTPDTGARGARSAPTAVSRARAVNRMNLRQWMLVVMPWGIIIVVTGAHAAVLAIVRAQGVQIPEDSMNGVVSTVLFFAVSMFASMTTQHFPFALGLGTTRRDFYAGTVVTAVLIGAVNAALLLICAQIERATDGLGVHLEAASILLHVTDNRVLLFFGVTLVTVAFAAVGMLAGVIYLRWRANGVFSAALVITIVAAAAALLITWQRGWPAVGRFFTDSPLAALVLGIPAAAAIVLFGAGYRMMRTVEV